MSVFWSVGLFVGISMFQKFVNSGRSRLTDKQQEELDALYDKWEREEREAKEEERRKREKES